MGYMRFVDVAQNRLRMTAYRVNEGYNLNSKVTSVLANGQWKGSRCFIIGGGPSVEKLDLSRLKNEKVIGINRAFEKYFCSILYMMDVQYIKLIEERKMDNFSKDSVLEKFKQFRGIKVVLTPMTAHRFSSDIFVIRTKLDKELSLDLNEGIYGGKCSGFGAIQLAMCLGSQLIYLLGYDLTVGEKTHWHSGYPKQSRNQLRDRLGGYREELEKYAQKIVKLGFRVINLNTGSALKCFEFGDLEEVLNGGK